MDPSSQAKNVGIIFNSDLNFETHIKSVGKIGACLLKKIYTA